MGSSSEVILAPTPIARASAAFALILFCGSMLLSATLLFLVEPLTGKMLMPLLGGTPAVWNTCLVFFQAVLLAGYLYAHAVLRFLPRGAQVVLHLLVTASPLLIRGLLPPHIPTGWNPPLLSNPEGWLLSLLVFVIGLPFFALSSNTSIMQRWFADCGRSDAHDPYFLYAASNAGSLAGLFCYPLLFEPLFRLHEQGILWSWLYSGYLVLTAGCAFLAWRWRKNSNTSVASAWDTHIQDHPITWKMRWRWIAFAFVPSSLMLGVTSAITADIPAIPLFWVLPLAVYLVSFVLVFAKKPLISHTWIEQRAPFLIVIGIFPAVSQTRFSLPVLLLLYLCVLFGLALLFHGALTRNRPSVRKLTEFYLCLSIGGVLGGILNSLIAPAVFNTVLELPLVLMFAALIRPTSLFKGTIADSVWSRRKDVLLPLSLLLCMVAVILGAHRAGIKAGRTETTLVFGYAMLWCLSFGKRRTRFVLGVLAIFAASYLYVPYGKTLLARRSFFGVYRVRNSPDQRFRLLFHGGTLHGMQSLRANQACEPLSYYTRSGPAGAIMSAAQSRIAGGNWAVVGLGAGAIAPYIQPGKSLSFYEIDPLVARIAKDTHYFTYLSKCAPSAQILLGDARLRLGEAPDGRYDLIVLDAFSGDSIPMHLLTQEALALYVRKLAPGGIIAFHISNLYFDLAPTLGRLAEDAHLSAFIGKDAYVTEDQRDAGKWPSVWIVMARQPGDLSAITSSTTGRYRWERLAADQKVRPWTDDYSNLLGVIKRWGTN